MRKSSRQPSHTWPPQRNAFRSDSELSGAEAGAEQPTITHISDGIYFAFIAWTSVGFGDLTPRTRVGKFVTIAWTITGVLQIIIIGGALINNLSELTTQGAQSMLLNYGEQNRLKIGSFNGTNAALLANELTVSDSPRLFGSIVGVLQNETVIHACTALCNGEVDALVADSNVMTLCFQQWQQTCRHRVGGAAGTQSGGSDQLQYSIVTNRYEVYHQVQAAT